MARQPVTGDEEERIRRSAGARHAPGNCVLRARIVRPSREGPRVAQLGRSAGRDAKTVRRRLHRFNEQGPDDFGDRPGDGRPQRRITGAERSRIVTRGGARAPGATSRQVPLRSGEYDGCPRPSPRPRERNSSCGRSPTTRERFRARWLRWPT
ncbi:helix-turn-helix domain-containing protein [Embleya hyalina]|uniref:helix-turn-helix domain-containing protein n=1 Tax=Embleya hyalina TaxID=516124 RepID=UPI000F81889A|nr:helix-turn-helix domain-containing protein [Embleya hyalina]